MKINLKSTILYSAVLAILLNIIQFFALTTKQAEAAFAPVWADSKTQAQTPAPAPTNNQIKVAAIPTPTTLPGTDASGGSGPVLATTATVPIGDSTFIATDLLNAGLKPDYASLYLAAQEATRTPWELLAAVHAVESGQSGSTSRTSSAGAEGPMQFMPATFNNYALDGNGDGEKDINNVADAVFTAGNYLAAGGASHGDYENALYNYNHSWGYVDKVMGIAHSLGLYLSFFIKSLTLCMESMNCAGKTIVEFFSPAISLKTCRFRSCSAIG
jgi:hypothetical protein